jgi:2-C-methyl-D-erythritol 4-phosphate cytidylyltransferase
MKNIAVILAAGKGSRFGADTPKQFIKLAGKPIIVYTLDTFQNCSSIDEIYIVILSNYKALVDRLVKEFNFTKVTKVLIGGQERADSSWAAITASKDKECNLIFHDAVRPFVSEKVINDCVNALDQWNAVDVVVDPTDTIVQVKNNFLSSIPDRRFLGRGQTPQAFKRSTIKLAYEKFFCDPDRIAFDDCGIVTKYLPEEPVLVVKGDERNFKITHQQDIYLADNFIKDGLLANAHSSVLNDKTNLEGKVVVIFGGSSGIGKALAETCREKGAKVHIFSRSNKCDITDSQAIKCAIHSVETEGDIINYVVNTVGILVRKPLSELSDEEISSNCAINYFGAINVARVCHPTLMKSKGMLVNFSSSSATRGRAGYSLYSSSKAAIMNLTQALAEEWQQDNIKVNCINPERTDTPMRRENFGNEPLKTLLSADFVAQATLSVMLSECTGQIITVRKQNDQVNAL